MIVTRYNLCMRQYNTWLGFNLIVGGSSPIDLTGATARMQFRKTACSAPVMDWSSPTDITFPTPVQGTLTVLKHVIMCPAGIYLYDVLVTLSSGDYFTYIQGDAEVERGITHHD